MLVQLIFMENSPTIPLEVSIGSAAISCGGLRITNPVFNSKANSPLFEQNSYRERSKEQA